ncbi:MAG: hydrogen gas-evolving membrane-bound hydrogenase subunit E [Oscillibacter sp.]|nr:hydrogen gas-evolving membrane-bound hydrogenase subunit E [Oscillibacter sp.]
MRDKPMIDPEFSSIWTLWKNGQIDLTTPLRSPGHQPLQALKEVEKYRPRHSWEAYSQYVRKSTLLYKIAATILCCIFITLMLLTVANLPRYGDPNAPTINEVSERYIEEGTEETGAVNTVAGMILDYRAFDTLGESFVLFTAVCSVAVLMNLSGKRQHIKHTKELINYADDMIVRGVCRLLVPVILLFGIYILLNGHLSPGGGFSGGAVLGAGLIIYSMVWGEEKASRVFPAKLVRLVVFCSLAFYCLAKSYSFYTGANHLPFLIPGGAPGHILSGGLIMPLNVAVGFVVCFTMYSFYMFFRRGRL